MAYIASGSPGRDDRRRGIDGVVAAAGPRVATAPSSVRRHTRVGSNELDRRGATTRSVCRAPSPIGGRRLVPPGQPFRGRRREMNRSSEFAPSTIFVTGGAGFIGSAAIRRLIATTPARVINVDKLTYAGNLDSLAAVADSPRYRFEQVDICDFAAIASRLRPSIAPTRSCTSPPSRTSTGRSTGRARSSTPTSSARTSCSRRRAPTGRA